MTIGKDKIRKLITLPIDLKESLEDIAKKEDRNLNNLIILILKEYVKDKKREAE